MNVLLIFIIIGFLFIFWINQSNARDKTRLIAKQLTIKKGLVFLDDSVMMLRLNIRLLNGSLMLYRVFSFEFSTPDAQRHNGKVTFIGSKVMEIQYFYDDYIESITNIESIK